MPEVLKRASNGNGLTEQIKPCVGMQGQGKRLDGWKHCGWVFGHACTVIGLGPIDVSKGKACNSNHRGFFFSVGKILGWTPIEKKRY